MAPQDETLARATAEANEIFGRMQSLVEERAAQGAQELNVLEIARESGLEVDDRTLSELHLPATIPVIRFVPWHIWWCWRPLWCWWWNLRYPWYHCCGYWWYRCHWYELW
jgi:hypothetical protein